MLTVCHVCVCSHCIYCLSDCSAGLISWLNFCKWKAENIYQCHCLCPPWQSVNVLGRSLVKMHKETRWASGWGLHVITLNHFILFLRNLLYVFIPSFVNSNCFLSIKQIKRGRFGFHEFIWHSKLIPSMSTTQNCCREQWRSVNFKTWFAHKILFFLVSINKQGQQKSNLSSSCFIITVLYKINTHNQSPWSSN